MKYKRERGMVQSPYSHMYIVFFKDDFIFYIIQREKKNDYKFIWPEKCDK